MNHQDTWESRKTIFLDWSQLNRLLHICLFELLGRDVLPQAFQDGDYWEVDTKKFSQTEMQLLLDKANADEEDCKNHEPNCEGHISGLTDSLAAKLLSSEMPFPVDKTVATDNGVYFMSAARPHTKDYTGRENPPVQD